MEVVLTGWASVYKRQAWKFGVGIVLMRPFHDIHVNDEIPLDAMV